MSSIALVISNLYIKGDKITSKPNDFNVNKFYWTLLSLWVYAVNVMYFYILIMYAAVFGVLFWITVALGSATHVGWKCILVGDTLMKHPGIQLFSDNHWIPHVEGITVHGSLGYQ